MNIKAIFHQKEPELNLKDCVFDRVVFLPDDQYRRFQKNMLDDYDFISQYRDEMYQDGDTVHCILVKGMNSSDGILVNSEGSGYARYAAYLPAAQAFLNEQKIDQKQILQDHIRRMKLQPSSAHAAQHGEGCAGETQFPVDQTVFYKARR